jgi:hypothetical protein
MQRRRVSGGIAVALFAAALVGLCFAVGAAARVGGPGQGADPDAAKSANGCGVERWPIKTMSDPQAGSVSLTVHSTSVHALRVRTAPTTLGTSRIGPVELTIFRIHARLVEFKIEADSDIHLVVADPSSGGTMIVEFPSPSCLAVPPPGIKAKISAARSALIAACGQPSTSHFSTITGTATITGVGFWDFKHGQTGVAPNAIELHPVLAFTGTCT